MDRVVGAEPEDIKLGRLFLESMYKALAKKCTPPYDLTLDSS